MLKKPELLAPAGDLKKLKIAVEYGADAVFLGGEEFGLRSNASNFTIEDIEEGVQFANKYNAKVYVTTNIFAHSENFEGFKEYVQKLEEIGVVGIIVSDPGYIQITQENTNLEIHVSTQQSIMNSSSVDFFHKLGAHRVVLGRELTAKEIKNIVDKTNVEIEIFIHGAVCSSYSGRCTLSNHMTLRDSNRGGCCQSCRWNYELVQKNENDYVNVVNGEQNYNKFNMSSRDMLLIENIPELMNLGVDSFKIEGRMKSFHYVATVVKVYRQAIDSYLENPDNYTVKEEWIEELKKAESRPASSGAFADKFTHNEQIYGEQYQKKTYDYCGVVIDYDNTNNMVIVEQRNFFKQGDVLEVTGPDIKPYKITIDKMYNIEDEEILKANHPLMKVKIPLKTKVKKNYIFRKEN